MYFMKCEYQKVKDHLMILIDRALPDTLLPPESKLCETMNVSRVTVRKAFSLLENDGLIVRRKGKGTFVKKQQERIKQLHIAILIPGNESSNGFSGNIITGCLFQSSKSDTRLHIIPMTEKIHKIFSEIDESHCDGVMIIAPKKYQANVLDAFVSFDKPTMVVNREIRNSNFSFVSTDHAGGVNEAVSYLIEKGHRKIAFIGLDRTDPCITDRYHGYLSAFAKHGIVAAPELTYEMDIFPGDDSFYEKAKSGFSDFYKKNQPDALIVSGSGTLCHTVMPILEPYKKLPEIVSFDRIPYEYEYRDKIHEIIQAPSEEMGKIALWNLERIIRGETGKINILLPPSFIIKNVK